MRLIRNAQKEADKKRKKEKKALNEFRKDSKKSGGGKNALRPPPEVDPDDGKHSDKRLTENEKLHSWNLVLLLSITSFNKVRT